MPDTVTISNPTIDDIRAAAARIAPHAHRTPVMTSRTLDERSGRALYFKCENFQRVGAFKFRGACNAVMSLPDEDASRGVVTHSSGNHAQALALAARIRGIPAHIVMPHSASPVKKEAVIGYGGRVTECEQTHRSREGTAQRIVEQTGGTLIPPCDHPAIIAGQGTVTLELLEQIDGAPLDAIIAPIGGGGLMSGTCLAAKHLQPSLRIIGAEPALADDAARSLAGGKRQPPVEPPRSIADGLLTGIGPMTWPVIREHVEDIMTVSEEQIIDAMRLVWERMKIIIEPSAATAVAAAMMGDRLPSEVKRVGVILTGGNVDLCKLPWLPRAAGSAQ